MNAERNKFDTIMKTFKTNHVFESFFNNSLVGHSITFQNGNFFVNQAFAKMLGYSVNELEKFTWQDVTHPDDLELSLNEVKSLIEGSNKGISFIKRYIRKDSSNIVVHIYATLIEYNFSEKIFLTTIVDITQEEKYLELLKRRENIYNKFLGASNNMIFLKDFDQKYILVNDAYAKFIQLEQSEIIGKADHEIIEKAISDKLNKTNNDVLSSNVSISNREAIKGSNLEILKFRVPISDNKFGIGGFIKDITNEVNYQKGFESKSRIYKTISECLSTKIDDYNSFLEHGLRTSVEMTGSEHGVILVCDEDLKEFSIKCFYSTTRDAEMCESFIGHNLTAEVLLKQILSAKESFIMNNHEAIKTNLSIPVDHPVIERVMVHPLTVEENRVAIICLANKKSDYVQEELSALTVLMAGVWNIVENKKITEESNRVTLQRNQMFNRHEAIMLIINPKTGDILECNPAAENFYGYLQEELLHMKIQQINQFSDSEINRLMNYAENKEQKYFTFPHKLKNGEIRYVDVYSSPIKYNDINALFSIIFDVTKREKAYRELKYISRHDYLTGIYNRRTFEAFFDDYNIAENYPLALIMGDVNSLKVINDSFGHNYGDLFIKESAKILRRVFNNDIVARVGGDEFGILIRNADEQRIREKIAELNEESSKSFVLNDTESLLSIALGYSIQSKGKNTYEELMKEAESFVYANKYYDSRSIKNNTVNIIMDTLFEKSAREKNHSNRVGEIACLLAKKLEMTTNDINKIRAAGYLHDIGKIGIDEYILNKQGKLTDDEWILMKSHVERSYRILSNSIEFLNIADIVRNHHERYDGFGYPRGLKGNNIPIESRILVIADSFDAMTNYRPYKKRMSLSEAREEILRCKGSQFDPKLVDVFIKMIDDKLIN